MWPRKHKFEVVPPAAEHRRPRVLFIAISFARGVKPFADDLDRERGVVSSRVALSSRSVEIQPLVPKVSPAFMLPPGTPRLPPVSPPAPPLLKCFKVGHLDEKSVVALAWGSTSSLIPPFFFRFFFFPVSLPAFDLPFGQSRVFPSLPREPVTTWVPHWPMCHAILT